MQIPEIIKQPAVDKHEEYPAGSLEAELLVAANDLGIPPELHRSYFEAVVYFIGWEATCLTNPATILSGNFNEEIEKMVRRINQSIGSEDLQSLQIPRIVIRDEAGERLINPLYLRAASDSGLEEQRSWNVKQLQLAIDGAATLEAQWSATEASAG